MKILYLYSELMGYQIPVFKEYVDKYSAKVHVVHWDHKKLTPYVPPVLEGVSYYHRSEFNANRLVQFAIDLRPNIVYVSGWMDKDYLSICRILRKKGIPVVAGSDTQWRGGAKQVLGTVYFKMILRRSFTHIWVAGPYQYEYARKLGFKKSEIIFNCLSADTNIFNSVKPPVIVPKKFVFVGRFEKIKGIEILLQAWDEIIDKKEWTLTFIGNGSLKSDLLSYNVEIIDFVQPEELFALLKNYGVLVLPSLKEPWALVIQEAMASGLPVIASNVCGAAPVFITDRFNGLLVEPDDIEELKHRINYIINMDSMDLVELARNALKRSSVITPEIVAASFLSVMSVK